jgi:peptidoglycan/LPS O-acetylase OafA/YrhL
MTLLVDEETGRIHSLDVLRALAVSYIVGIHHLDDYASSIFAGRLDAALSPICLGTLVYMSGYLLAHKYRALDSLPEVRRFVTRRFLRIYPLYLLALLLFASCSLLPYRSLLREALLLNMLWGAPVMTLWFVALICFYYLLFPLIVFRAPVRGIVVRASLICAALTGIHLFCGVPDVRLVVYGPVFFLGVVAARAGRLSALMKKGRFAVLSAALCCSSCLLYFRWANREVGYLPVLVFTLTALSPVLCAGQRIASRVDHRVFLRISYASYCMYLFHRVVFHFLLQIYRPETALVTVGYLALVGLPLLYVIAAKVQSIYDGVYARATAPRARVTPAGPSQ